MLEISVDLFSGRQNPTRLVVDEDETRATLRELANARQLLADTTSRDAVLGTLRGFQIELLSDDLAADFELGTSIYLPAGPQAVDSRANELGERLIALMERGQAAEEAQDVIPLEMPLRELLMTQLRPESRMSVADEAVSGAVEAEAVAPTVTCWIELAPYDPGFWNNNAFIRTHNNCYHYASNKRRDTFWSVPGGGQPGAGCGRMYTAITCAEVTRAALCDGLHHRFNCFPDSEKPRYLVALVVAPGPAFRDFHWYRKNKEGFWSHKPGQTAVRNVDNRGQIIHDPQFCDRGPYTQFCGYFYTCRSQRIR